MLLASIIKISFQTPKNKNANHKLRFNYVQIYYLEIIRIEFRHFIGMHLRN